jgi:uncharacterized cupredoxin-like copper-binding protein
MARTLRRLLPLLLGAACLVFIAACGDSNDDSSSSSDSTPAAAAPPADTTSTPASGGGASAAVSLTAGEGGKTPFFFTPPKLTAKAGSVTFTLDNPSKNQAPHAIAIEGNGVDKDGETAQPGGKSTVTVDLKPGKYEFYCPVPGHKEAGMQGTLTVT